MLPTFDFVNILRAAIRGVIAAVANPVSIMVALAAIVSTLAGGYLGIYTSLNFPNLDLLPFDIQSSDWLSFLCYCIDYDTLITVWRVVRGFFVGVISASFSFVALLMVSYWTHNVYVAIRSSVKDLGA